MKKILHVSKYYPPHIGGIEDMCHSIVEVCKGYFEQKVFCYNSHKNNIIEVFDGVEIIRSSLSFSISSQPISLSYYFNYRSLLKTFKPDIVHFHYPNPYGAFYINLITPKKIRVILHWHSDIIEQRFLYFLVKPFEMILLKRSEIILCTSPNYIEASVPLKKFKKKTKVLQNVISPRKILDVNLVKVNNIINKYKSPIILFLGRHVKYKGLKYLIEAERYIKSNCEILIGGDGPLTEELRNSSKSKRIHFIGRIDENDLVDYYKAAQIFAFPSITKNEAFGVALAEAMYYGCVPVTFTIEGSGVNWVNLNNVTGLEVPSFDYIEYANAIDRLLTNPELLNRLSNGAIERSKSLFTIDSIKEKLVEIYS
mgnify:CR=1 FL=1